MGAISGDPRRRSSLRRRTATLFLFPLIALLATAGNSSGAKPTTPQNTSPPTVSGSAVQGQTLTASTGSWSPSNGVKYAYQWRRCDTNGANCRDIGGATSQTYLLGSADVGSTIRVTVTASNTGGSSSAGSAQTAVVHAVAPANTSAPTISGTAQQGQTLTASTGTWSGTQPISYAYQWRRCDTNGANCVDIIPAGTQTYTLTSSDVGSTIRIRVTATNSVGSSTANSAQTAIVAAPPAPPTNTSPPTISGTAQQGQTLTASTGTWSGTQPISYGYQWRRCDTNGANCVDISGATSQTDLLGSADVGSTIRVTVTATNTTGSSSAGSAQTAVVQAVSSAPANTNAPTISGTAQQGQTLTASTGTWSGTQPISYGYQWRRCDTNGANCADISGATSQTDLLGSADVGSTIRVTVTATNTAGSSSAGSAQSAVVQAVSSAPANTNAPTISGTAQQGQTLTASTGTWSGTQPISYGYQWRRCDTNGANCVDIIPAGRRRTR